MDDSVVVAKRHQLPPTIKRRAQRPAGTFLTAIKKRSERLVMLLTKVVQPLFELLPCSHADLFHLSGRLCLNCECRGKRLASGEVHTNASVVGDRPRRTKVVTPHRSVSSSNDVWDFVHMQSPKSQATTPKPSS